MKHLTVLLMCLLVSAVRADEIEDLRAEGPAGLKKILDKHATIIASHKDDDAWHKARAEIDAVAAQRDAYASKLYWYTDLDQAKRAAKDSGKPILSLRLLGRLDEELSCANSRLFRTTLYPDPTISKLLGEKFVLHWQSVRPAPRITIDFGDGRKLERTITGNSIHYVLDSDGQPIDALPGLYSAAAFERALNDALSLHAIATKSPDAQQAIRNVHDARITVRHPPAPPKAQKAVPAAIAAPVAMTKSGIERPLLAAIGQPVLPQPLSFATLQPTRGDVKIDFSPQVLAVVRSKVKDFTSFPQLIENLRTSIAIDTSRNESDLHNRIHQWFADGQVKDLDSLNERVYSELFLTPSTDPWLGLAPDDAFAAIDDSGKR